MVSNMFIMSLAAADIAVGAIVMPISSVYAITGRWVFGLMVCQFWLSADYTASTASIFNLFILSMDRYWSITSPLRYLRRRTKKRALIMIGLVWIGSALWILPIVGWHFIASGGKRIYPPTVCETEFAGNVVFKVMAACLNFYIPTLLMVYLYGRIFFEIKKRSRFEIGQCNHGSRTDAGSGATGGNDSLADDTPQAAVAPKASQVASSSKCKSKGLSAVAMASTQKKTNNLEPNADGETHQFRNLTVLSYHADGAQSEIAHFEGVTVNVEYVDSADENQTPDLPVVAGEPGRKTLPRKNTTKRRQNDSESVVLQKEKKAARQLGVIMGAFVLCWLPYFVLFMVIAFCGNCVNPKIHIATIWLGYINSTLNPILYPLCNANFKRAFKRMLAFSKTKASFLAAITGQVTSKK